MILDLFIQQQKCVEYFFKFLYAILNTFNDIFNQKIQI